VARFTSIEVYNAILEQGLVPVFYNSNFEESKNIVQAISNALKNLRILFKQFPMPEEKL